VELKLSLHTSTEHHLAHLDTFTCQLMAPQQPLLWLLWLTHADPAVTLGTHTDACASQKETLSIE
jgi:S-adenosylmethionine/arginine decarboxylase-like enzyme